MTRPKQPKARWRRLPKGGKERTAASENSPGKRMPAALRLRRDVERPRGNTQKAARGGEDRSICATHLRGSKC